MQTHSVGYLHNLLEKNKKKYYPWNGQIELTYRCNLDCIHCYCKGSEDKDKELSAQDIKKILNEICEEGCLSITLTGGEPLVRDDFLDIYKYAKERGFIITIFTNAILFTDKLIAYLKKSPPLRIEITLNGITTNTYETITQVNGSFAKAIENIRKLAQAKLPLKIKSNSLKQNKDEIHKVKNWTEELLGRPEDNKYFFQYDTMIYPRLNGDKAPLKYRLSFEETLEIKHKDSDLLNEYNKGLECKLPVLKRQPDYLYLCNAWMSNFFVNPYGRLKFCMFFDKFSSDLRITPFKEGFYKAFSQIPEQKFKTNSKCITCGLRPICYYCPARAYLETGSEESPVSYYCEQAKQLKAQMQVR